MHNSRIDHVIDLGMTAYRSHLYEAAAERLQKAVELDPDDWNARLFLGMSYLRGEKYIKAHSVFLSIGRQCPNHDLQDTARGALELIEHRSVKD